eukprot:Clim_evm27s232 gene=Clim_evmTU27s232
MTAKVEPDTSAATTKRKRGDKKEPGQKPVPAFLRKLHKILHDKDIKSIAWSRNGTAFVVKSSEDFSKDVLPLYFKHNNFASFVRQLNMYNFRKISDGGPGMVTQGQAHVWEFSHPMFRKGRDDLISQIHRKNPSAQKKQQQQAQHAAEEAAKAKGSSSSKALVANHTLSKEHTQNDLNALTRELSNLRIRQAELEAKVVQLQTENQNLWQQNRRVQKRQNQTIHNILLYLAAMSNQPHKGVGANPNQKLITMNGELNSGLNDFVDLTPDQSFNGVSNGASSSMHKPATALWQQPQANPGDGSYDALMKMLHDPALLDNFDANTFPAAQPMDSSEPTGAHIQEMPVDWDNFVNDFDGTADGTGGPTEADNDDLFNELQA